jgi:plastocyanin
MNRQEIIARTTLLLIVIGLPLAAFGYEDLLRPLSHPHRVIEVEAWAPEAGGFSPNVVHVAAGETVTLRFTAMDVTHGVAIGPGLDADLGYIDPGERREITLTFEQPGTYTYYCTTWCSLEHWRMRGIIEVRDRGTGGMVIQPQVDPVIQQLVNEGVNIDLAHTGERHWEAFETRPSVHRGETLAATASIPAEVADAAWQRGHTPNQALDVLQPAHPALSQAELRDIVAYLWHRDIRYDEATTRQYELNCAACHGESGRAEGPAAPFTAETTTAFADNAYMFTMRSDVLYAKIRRGGMGTDMPNFGTLFTPQETWALVDYLWSLALEPDGNE